MQTEINESAISEKTNELCQAILSDPKMGSIRRRIDAFLGDESARGQYDAVIAKGQALQEKQQKALPLTGEEITEFESQRDALVKNPVARGFLDAQEEIHEIQESIHKQVSKTLELGRVPTAEDLDEGSCGSGCGCHH